MKSALDALPPDSAAVIADELASSDPDLLAQLRSTPEPTNDHRSAVNELLARAVVRSVGDGLGAQRARIGGRARRESIPRTLAVEQIAGGRKPAGSRTALWAQRTMHLEEFPGQASDVGPCVGIHSEVPMAPTLPSAGYKLRTMHGLCTKTLGALYASFAKAWHFPPWFGRNMDAFDDFMRDLDNMINTASGKPPAPGYFTHITDAHLILADQPEAFPWFAKCMPFYR